MFAALEDYYRVGYGDIIGKPGVHYQPDFLSSPTKIKRILHTLHNFRGIARVVNLPFKSLWYRHYFSQEYREDDQYMFIFFSRWHRICECGFISYLRRNYPGCKCVLFLQDINNAKKLDIQRMKDLFDHVMLFERNYARECDVEYYPLVYCEGLKEVPAGPRDIDLLFVGKAKGRYDLLKKIYDRLSSNGIYCEFYLSQIDQKVDPADTGIHIVDKVPYEDNIRLLKRSKCVLDIIPPGTDCNTLRMSEAMYYNNRVITNNLNIVKEEYYSPELISLYTDPEEMDLEFLKKDYENVVYPLKDRISPDAFLAHLDAVFNW